MSNVSNVVGEDHYEEDRVQIKKLPGPDYASPAEFFEDYPFGQGKLRSEPGSLLDGGQYLATAEYVHPWSNDLWMPEPRRSLERSYPFTILADGEIAGEIGLESPSVCRSTYTVGYAIGREHWNQGICTEALKQIVTFAFEELCLHKIVSDTASDNPASLRVLEKVGFRKEEQLEIQTVFVGLFNPEI